MEKRSITIEHDRIEYRCDNVPAKKYDNWSALSHAGINTADYTAAAYPFMLQVEPTTICNLSCPLCPAGRDELNRPRRHLTLMEFKSIIDDMEDYLLFIVLWGWGEPFTNPELPSMIRYASERNIQVVTSTNAHFLENGDYVAEILSSGLSNLIVAIDSLDMERYRVYRKNGNLDRAVVGLAALMQLKTEMKSATRINLRMVIMRQNEHELKRIRHLARKNRVDTFTVKTLNPSCGLSTLDEDLIPKNRKYRRYQYQESKGGRVRKDRPCMRVWTMSNIFSNGDVAPCGYDYAAELKVGNITRTPLSVLWNSQAYRDLRKKVYFEKSAIAKCRECTINYELAGRDWFVEKREFNLSIPARMGKIAGAGIREGRRVLYRTADAVYAVFPPAKRVVKEVRRLLDRNKRTIE
jgi:radical SAM protein with 4Fe4S-binding SPASM domain